MALAIPGTRTPGIGKGRSTSRSHAVNPPETVAEVVRLTTKAKPANGTHWSTRIMAEAVGISEASVRRIWHNNGLKPHLVETYKVSNDPAVC